MELRPSWVPGAVILRRVPEVSYAGGAEWDGCVGERLSRLGEDVVGESGRGYVEVTGKAIGTTEVSEMTEGTEEAERMTETTRRT